MSNNYIGVSRNNELIWNKYEYFKELIGDPIKHVKTELRLGFNDIDFCFMKFEDEFPNLTLYTELVSGNNEEALKANKSEIEDPYDYNEVSAEYSNERTNLYYDLSTIIIVRQQVDDSDSYTFLNIISSRDCVKKYTDYFNSLDIITKEQKKKFYMISQRANSLSLREFTISQKISPLDTHYNDDVPEFYNHIMNEFENKDKGITLLHGPPGTGKTSFIRRIISETNKKCIYMPPDMISHIASPSFGQFMYNHPDSIIFIEDAESILLKRENSDHSSSVANLLNMSDGLLGDAMRMHIVCTFNTDLMDIDSALRRPGRLIGEMEFSKLKADKADDLLKSLNKSPKGIDMTLGEVYNEDHSIEEKKQPFGFIPQTN